MATVSGLAVSLTRITNRLVVAAARSGARATQHGATEQHCDQSKMCEQTCHTFDCAARDHPGQDEC